MWRLWWQGFVDSHWPLSWSVVKMVQVSPWSLGTLMIKKKADYALILMIKSTSTSNSNQSSFFQNIWCTHMQSVWWTFYAYILFQAYIQVKGCTLRSCYQFYFKIFAGQVSLVILLCWRRSPGQWLHHKPKVEELCATFTLPSATSSSYHFYCKVHVNVCECILFGHPCLKPWHSHVTSKFLQLFSGSTYKTAIKPMFKIKAVKLWPIRDTDLVVTYGWRHF